jgi:hypothetical protein
MRRDTLIFMSGSRTLPLFDESTQPSSWNERMAPEEYAVHYSNFGSFSNPTPFCTVFSSLAEAEAYAKDQIAQRPDLRCRIYDHRGLIGKPVREFKGNGYKGDSDLSPRFRRWLGTVLFFGGLILTIVDWQADFRFIWPAMIGTRMLIPGLLLLLTEAILLFYARYRRTHAGDKGTR